jgi:elongation factor 1-gamma
MLATTERAGRIGFTKSKLYKTDAFLEAQPFGTVPAASSPDGRTGVFEIEQYHADRRPAWAGSFSLNGGDAHEASRIDGFLDASLVFARDSQIYLLALRDGNVTAELHARVQERIEQAMIPPRNVLVGNDLTLADICDGAELCLFHNERARRTTLDAVGLPAVLRDDFARTYPRSAKRFHGLLVRPAFVPDVSGYLEKIEATVLTLVPWALEAQARDLEAG